VNTFTLGFSPCFDIHLFSGDNIRPSINKDGWISVLRIASDWSFESVREFAIRELLPLVSSMDKIVLGQQFSITEWLLDAYHKICARNRWLTQEECNLFSKEDLFRIGHVMISTRVAISRMSVVRMQDIIAETFRPSLPVRRTKTTAKLATVSQSLPAHNFVVRPIFTAQSEQ
jgi:hypothetical protein